MTNEVLLKTSGHQYDCITPHNNLCLYVLHNKNKNYKTLRVMENSAYTSMNKEQDERSVKWCYPSCILYMDGCQWTESLVLQYFF